MLENIPTSFWVGGLGTLIYILIVAKAPKRIRTARPIRIAGVLMLILFGLSILEIFLGNFIGTMIKAVLVITVVYYIYKQYEKIAKRSAEKDLSEIQAEKKQAEDELVDYEELIERDIDTMVEDMEGVRQDQRSKRN